MKIQTLNFILLAAFGCVAAAGQSTYKGLTPGKSTRPEVERVLGDIVKEVSPTLIEYGPQPLSGRIFVQYRDDDSTTVERIEMLCHIEKSTCDDLLMSLSVRIPFEEDTVKYDGDKWKLLYGSPLFIGAAGSVSEDTTGPTPSRIVFYGRELYDAELDAAREKNESAYKKGGSVFFVAGILNGKTMKKPEPVYPAAARVARTSGIVRVAISCDENGKVVGAQAGEGPALLRPAAEDAALKARISPTVLSGKPVRVIGTLTYNFVEP